MLSTLDRWLLGRYLRAYAAFLGASLLLFTVIDGFSNVELLLRRGRAHEVAGASWPIGAALVERYGTMLPELFFVLSPHFVLVAGLWTAVALIRSRELVSLLAAGYSTARIATPMIAAACALSALTWADRDLLLPAWLTSTGAGSFATGRPPARSPTGGAACWPPSPTAPRTPPS